MNQPKTMKSFLKHLFLLLLAQEAASQVTVGSFTMRNHDVAGEIVALSDRVLEVRNFVFDGNAPAAFFWADTSATPTSGGSILMDASPSNSCGSTKLPGADGTQTYRVEFPEGISLNDFLGGSISVWCEAFSANFGEVVVPATLDGLVSAELGPALECTSPEIDVDIAEITIGSLITRQHDVSGTVVALSERVLEVRNFQFDGNAPAAFFWADTGTPSSGGTMLLDGAPSMNCGGEELPGADGTQTFRVEFPDGSSVLDYLGGTISVWCEAFSANFGEVQIPASLEGLAATEQGPMLECSSTPVPDFVPTPDGYNCEPLNDNFQVRWQVNGENLDIELIGRINDGEYMSFGPSGSTTSTQMVGADTVVADLFNGELRAVDYYMSSQGQCSNGGGVCPDAAFGFSDDLENVSGEQGADLTLVRYSRPLTPRDVGVTDPPVDLAISIATGVTTFVVWALGPIDDDSGLPFFHSIDYPRDDVSMEFGRATQDNCVPLMNVEEEEPEEFIPFFRPILSDVTEFTARIGPSGGDRGYVTITGQDAWGISWYINDAIIPIIEMRRGTTYRFLVNGGNDPSVGSQHHPLYLTSNLEGGIAQSFPATTETVYAGIDVSADGTSFTATAQGPLCEFEGTDESQQAMDDGISFPLYLDSLDTSCTTDTTLSSAAGVLEFTPDANTPDLLYYQCVTHRSLGWEVHVIDADAPSLLEVGCDGTSTTARELTAGLTLSSYINPQTNTLWAELVWEGQDWLALAFTDGAAQMIGAESVIGLPNDANTVTNPGKYDMSDRTVAGVNLMADAKQTLIDASIEQNETHTVLTFTKLLFEEGEHPIDLEQEHTFLWAVGFGNPMGMHRNRGSEKFRPSQCRVSFNGVEQNSNFLTSTEGDDGGGDNIQTLWAAHGGCASVAWGILVPLAIGSSVIRETLESLGLPKGAWFQLHRGLNTLAAILTICAFGIAVHILNDANRPHFTENNHTMIGLIIFILTLLQALNGIFRPHVPHASPDDTGVTNPEVDEEEVDQKEETAAKAEGEKTKVRIFWEYGHRILGVGVLFMAWWQVQDGLGRFFNRFEVPDLRGAFWGVTLAITGVVVLVKIFQVMKKQK